MGTAKVTGGQYSLRPPRLLRLVSAIMDRAANTSCGVVLVSDFIPRAISKITNGSAEPILGRREPRVPDGMRLYVVGDLHGCPDLLEQMGKLIEHDVAGRRPAQRTILIFLGDYLDRGPDSREVLDMLMAGPSSDIETVYLKGNHEAMLLKFLADPTYGLTWRDYGGMETMESYGVAQQTLAHDPMAYADASRLLATSLPADHLDFLRSLVPSISIGDYFFVHAGILPGTKLDEQREEEMLWIRGPFLMSNKNYGKIIVHGHTPVEQPEIRRNRIGIDTGACLTGVLTCLCLEGADRWFLQTGP